LDKPMSAIRTRVTRLREETPDRDLWILAIAMALSAAIVVAYVLATRPNGLAGDQHEYDLQGRFFVDGHLWWTTTPFGIAHATAWKAPAYPAWVGLWYALIGTTPTGVTLIQGLLLAPATVLLTWLLARRLFGLRAAAAAALVTAVFPLAWEFYGLLYSEALAIPLTMLVLVLTLDRTPTTRRAAGIGAVVGVCILVRPTSFFLFAGVAVAWILAVGLRRAAALTGLAVAVAVLVVAPWTIRNAIVLNGFIPVSVQDAAAYGTFNAESANDPNSPYAWRISPAVFHEAVGPTPVDDPELRSRLQDAARDYIRAHPTSVAKAFFWNGLSRFWDIRRPGNALAEVRFDGRSHDVTAAGLWLYYLLLPLALIGLWRMRSRRQIVLPILALALAASLVFTVQAGTRYRAPLEPLIVALAASNLARRRDPRTQRRSPASAATSAATSLPSLTL
jgi:4-amino-4-deoxy-L-arabinose transferase-like glycosyltransferase